MRTAVVAGGTGLVGKVLVEQLLATPAFDRVATLGRRKSGREHPRLKGPERPVDHIEDRVAVLAALSCVDHVIVLDEDTPAALIT